LDYLKGKIAADNGTSAPWYSKLQMAKLALPELIGGMK